MERDEETYGTLQFEGLGDVLQGWTWDRRVTNAVMNFVKVR